MDEQVLFNHVKALIDKIDKEINEIKDGNDKLKKENQELKETLMEINQLYKADSEYPSQNGLDCHMQSTDYKLVDLGLPSGTLWMDRNVGASSPTDFGLYFSWGETQGYTADEVGETKQFDWADYKYSNGKYNALTKYCNKSVKGYYGYTDNLVTLKATDDAVLQNIHKCQMPTKAQLQELIDNTTYEWTTQEGVKGGLFTSKINGNSIFVPAVGFCGYGVVKDDVDEYCYLWSSSLYEDSCRYAWGLCFYSK